MMGMMWVNLRYCGRQPKVKIVVFVVGEIIMVNESVVVVVVVVEAPSFGHVAILIVGLVELEA